MLDFERSLYALSLTLLVTCAVWGELEDSVPKDMEKHQIVPDVLPKAPVQLLEVHYQDRAVKLGNVLKPREVAKEPLIFWNADEDSFYTVCMCDPDAPSRANPKAREWKHWLVGNVPGTEISNGTVLCPYAGSTPPQGTGPHRYVFVVYKQPGKLNFTETPGENRAKFSISKFAEKYKLGNPVAGNFFLSEWSA